MSVKSYISCKLILQRFPDSFLLKGRRNHPTIFVSTLLMSKLKPQSAKRPSEYNFMAIMVKISIET
jgi:hypothetical protein